MAKLKRLSEIDEELVEFNRARIKEEVSNGIYDLMVRTDVTRTELAKLIGTYKSRISLMLNGEQNFQIETLADIFLVLGRAVHFTLGADTNELRLLVDEVEPADRAIDPEEWEREHEYKEDEINGEEEEEKYEEDEKIKAVSGVKKELESRFKKELEIIEEQLQADWSKPVFWGKQAAGRKGRIYLQDRFVTTLGGQYKSGVEGESGSGADFVFSCDTGGF